MLSHWKIHFVLLLRNVGPAERVLLLFHSNGQHYKKLFIFIILLGGGLCRPPATRSLWQPLHVHNLVATECSLIIPAHLHTPTLLERDKNFSESGQWDMYRASHPEYSIIKFKALAGKVFVINSKTSSLSSFTASWVWSRRSCRTLADAILPEMHLLPTPTLEQKSYNKIN